MQHQVLTIQSHVAYGYVGNTAAVFPLQLLGFSPVVINTVQFSNHTNHKVTTGDVFTPEHIKEVIRGVRELGIFPKLEGLLSGYLGDVSVGAIVLDLAKEIKRANPKALWCCDPVMGDTDSGVFVRDGIPEFMKEHFLNGLADITTPNQFELELLCGRKMKDRKDAIETSRSLFCSKGCQLVFITSLRTADVPADKIETLAVTPDKAWAVSTPYIDLDPFPKGQGDVFAAIAFGDYLRNRDPRGALIHATSSLYGLVKSTEPGDIDLPVVDDRKDILEPSVCFEAVPLD